MINAEQIDVPSSLKRAPPQKPVPLGRFLSWMRGLLGRYAARDRKKTRTLDRRDTPWEAPPSYDLDHLLPCPELPVRTPGLVPAPKCWLNRFI